MSAGRRGRSARAAASVRALLAADLDQPADAWDDEDDYEQVPARASEPSRAAPTGTAVLLRPGAGPLADWLHRRGLRADPGVRGVVAIGCAALIAAVVAGAWLLIGRPQQSPVAPVARPPASSAASSSRSVPPGSGSPASPSAAALVVNVIGRVRHPGVYRLGAGSRVDDALRAAGGAVPGVDLSALNLARKLTDGEQVAVGVPAATPPAGGLPTGASVGGVTSGPESTVDLNTATLAQLDGLPGVGPVLAQHVLDWRTAHGRFDSVDQLREVSGIGPSKYASLRPLVTV